MLIKMEGYSTSHPLNCESLQHGINLMCLVVKTVKNYNCDFKQYYSESVQQYLRHIIMCIV